MISPLHEKRLLQSLVLLACFVPLLAGISGALNGPALVGGTTALIDLDSHFRYLSGLLLGIGAGFLSTIPHIEKRSKRFQTLTFIVFVGGIARLLGLFYIGMPSRVMQAALVMELVVTPLLCLWQHRVAKRFCGLPG